MAVASYVMLPDSQISSRAAYTFAQVSSLIVFSSVLVLLWDYACHWSHERRAVWSRETHLDHPRVAPRRRRWNPGKSWTKVSFVLSRYLAIAQTLLVAILHSQAQRSGSACDATRFLPFGFAIVLLAAHVVMSLRLYRMFNGSTKVLVTLAALCAVDFGLQLFAYIYVKPVRQRLASLDLDLHICICYLTPTSPLASIAFISPTLFHHTVLLLTLYASHRHAQAEQVLNSSSRTSVMAVLRRGQIAYVLSYCLANFANVVLVLQTSRPEYRLIGMLPAMGLTQIFLGRIHFALRSFLNDDSGRHPNTGMDLSGIVHLPSDITVNNVSSSPLPASRRSPRTDTVRPSSLSLSSYLAESRRRRSIGQFHARNEIASEETIRLSALPLSTPLNVSARSYRTEATCEAPHSPSTSITGFSVHSSQFPYPPASPAVSMSTSHERHQFDRLQDSTSFIASRPAPPPPRTSSMANRPSRGNDNDNVEVELSTAVVSSAKAATTMTTRPRKPHVFPSSPTSSTTSPVSTTRRRPLSEVTPNTVVVRGDASVGKGSAKAKAQARAQAKHVAVQAAVSIEREYEQAYEHEQDQAAEEVLLDFAALRFARDAGADEDEDEYEQADSVPTTPRVEAGLSDAALVMMLQREEEPSLTEADEPSSSATEMKATTTSGSELMTALELEMFTPRSRSRSASWSPPRDWNVAGEEAADGVGGDSRSGDHMGGSNSRPPDHALPRVLEM